MTTGKFQRHSRRLAVAPNDATPAPAAVTPIQVAKAYNFPAGVDLNKRSICVIELGGGYLKEDLYLYCDKLGVKHPTLNWYGVDGAIDNLFPSEADVEVQLDQCVIAAVCPGITINTIFADNSDQGFANAILKAVTLKPDAISISWGGPEDQWDADGRAALDAAMKSALDAGIAVYAASGDNGSTDGESDGANHVDYPASSPYATACGGTRLILDANGNRVSETVWDINNGNGSTGGGVSGVYSATPEQALLGFPKRHVPDIAGNADPASGYKIKADFIDQSVGGTSAVAPLYAALHALLQSYFTKPLGDLRPVFYALQPTERFDVLTGTNGAFSAAPGYDCCTGMGVVDGVAVLKRLQAPAAAGLDEPGWVGSSS